jgi:uncharacterized membrane protein YbjE (DUF340 family)
MKIGTIALALVLAPTIASAHHEEIVRQTATAIDLGWPILAVVAGAIVAQVRSWLS